MSGLGNLPPPDISRVDVRGSCDGSNRMTRSISESLGLPGPLTKQSCSLTETAYRSRSSAEARSASIGFARSDHSFALRSHRAWSRLPHLPRSSKQPFGELGRARPIRPYWRREEHQPRRRLLGNDAPAKSEGRSPELGGGNPTPEPPHTTDHP